MPKSASTEADAFRRTSVAVGEATMGQGMFMISTFSGLSGMCIVLQMSILKVSNTVSEWRQVHRREPVSLQEDIQW